MKKVLGLGVAGGFPYQLSPSKHTGKDSPIPAASFSDGTPDLWSIFSGQTSIYVTPEHSFKIEFRDVFQASLLTHTSGKASKRWLSGPNMPYWAQKLNFATWFSTEGCGISRDSSLNMPVQVRSFYVFHVYFTIRRILYQTGGIPNVSALADDAAFSKTTNHHVTASYKRLCNEFGIPPGTDLRYTHGANHGLDTVCIYATNIGSVRTTIKLPQ